MPHVEQLHTNAFLTLARAAPPGSPALVVHDGEVPREPVVAADALPPYVLLYTYTSRPDGSSLTHQSDHAITRGIFHCVGSDAAAARAIAGRVAAGLLDVTPIIAGRVCFPIRDAGDSRPPRPDDTISPRVMDQVVVYTLESLPA